MGGYGRSVGNISKMGLLSCAGALLGGVLIDALPVLRPWPGIQAVFLLSGLLRLLARIFLAGGIREGTVPAVYLFSYVGEFRPLLGFTRGAQRVMRSHEENFLGISAAFW